MADPVRDLGCGVASTPPQPSQPEVGSAGGGGTQGAPLQDQPIVRPGQPDRLVDWPKPRLGADRREGAVKELGGGRGRVLVPRVARFPFEYLPLKGKEAVEERYPAGGGGWGCC